jgi:hypothetical protein
MRSHAEYIDIEQYIDLARYIHIAKCGHAALIALIIRL